MENSYDTLEDSFDDLESRKSSEESLNEIDEDELYETDDESDLEITEGGNKRSDRKKKNQFLKNLQRVWRKAMFKFKRFLGYTKNERKNKQVTRKLIKIFAYIIVILFCLFINLIVFGASGIVFYFKYIGEANYFGDWNPNIISKETKPFLTSKFINVQRESEGEVHIIGGNNIETIFGQGFLHAQDRFSQMEINRHTAKGKLSEMIGEKGIALDILARQLCAHNFSKMIYQNLPQEYKNYLIAYADGVNSYIHSNRRKIVPLELQILGFFSFDNIKNWEPHDSLSIQLFQHFKLSHNHEFEFQRLLYIVNGYSKQEIDEFLPTDQENKFPTIIDDFHEYFQNQPKNKYKYYGSKQQFDGDSQNIEELQNQIFSQNDRKNAKTERTKTSKKGKKYKRRNFVENWGIEDYYTKEIFTQNGKDETTEITEGTENLSFFNHLKSKIFQLFKMEECLGEQIIEAVKNPVKDHCNAYIVSGDKTDTGKPYLSNEVKGRYHFINDYYQNHLKSTGTVAGTDGDKNGEVYDRNALDVTGISIPGIPFVEVGRNQKIGWSISSSMLDVIDLLVYSQNDEETQYEYKGKLWDYQIRNEKINVRRSSSINFRIRMIQSSTGLETVYYRINPSKLAVTLKWSSMISNNTGFIAMANLNFAENFDHFKSALSYFQLSPTNFIYGDVENNIGLVSVGIIPVRNQQYSGMFPLYNSNCSNCDWIGYYPNDFSYLPILVNPSQGFIIASNNKLSKKKTFSYDFQPGIIAKRLNLIIYEFIQSTKLTVNDHMKKIQNDDTSQLFLEFKFVFDYIFQNFDVIYDHYSLTTTTGGTRMEGGMEGSGKGREKEVIKEIISGLTEFDGNSDSVYYTVFEIWFSLLLEEYLPLPISNSIDIKLFTTFVLSKFLKNFKNLDHSCELFKFGESLNQSCSVIVIDIINNLIPYERKENGISSFKIQSIPIWKNIHSIFFQHDILDKIDIYGLNCLYAKRIEATGDFFTVNTNDPIPIFDRENAKSSFWNTQFVTSQGPVYKQIINFGSLENSVFIYPMGQSTELLSKFLDNFIDKWIKKEYQFLKVLNYKTSMEMHLVLS